MLSIIGNLKIVVDGMDSFMDKTIQIWRVNGRPESTDTAAEEIVLQPEPVSLDDASRRLPGGGYTTFRTFGHTQVLELADHFARLEETARLAGHPLRLARARVRLALRQALEAYPAEEARVRVTLDLEKDPGALYLLVEPLHTPPAQAYEQGVRVVTHKMQRQNPKAKLTRFIETASAVRQTLPTGVNEAVMIGEDGRVLEGLSSNFFAVKDGIVWTAEEGVLSGITRSMVLELIRCEGIMLRLDELRAEDLPTLDEAFITSASRAVLPVTEMDGRPVGSGLPGPITQKLLHGYQQQIAAHLETI